MRALVTSEIAEVSGGLNPCPPCPPDGCPQGPDVEIPGRSPRRGPDATTGVGSPLVIDSGSINFHLFVLAIHDAEGNYHLALANKPGAIAISAEDSSFDAEWASMTGPLAADSDRATFFAKWFESASKNELATLKDLVDTLKNTLVQANKVGFSMTIANLNAMSNNLRDAISGAAPAANCGWSFGIDVSNLHREAPHDLSRLAGWEAIMNLWPAPRAGNI